MKRMSLSSLSRITLKLALMPQLFLCFQLAIAEPVTSGTTVAVVNVRYLLQHAPQSNEASKALKKRFSGTEQELDNEAEAIRKLNKNLRQPDKPLSREEKIEKERELRNRKRTQNRALEDYREDLRLAKNAALDDVQKIVFVAIDEVRKTQNIDIVIQDFVSANEHVDITQRVLNYLRYKLKANQLENKLKK